MALANAHELLNKLSVIEASELYRDERFLVIKPTEVASSITTEVRTCYIPRSYCTEGFLANLRRNRALIVRKAAVSYRLFELNLDTLELNKLKEPPALATLGEDKRVEIHHGSKVIKVQRGVPKHWIYPDPKPVVPCGDKYWLMEGKYFVLLSREGKLIKRGKGDAVCVMGRFVSPSEAPTLRAAPLKKIIKLGRRITFPSHWNHLLFPNGVLLLGREEGNTSRIEFYDRELKKIMSYKLKGRVKFILHTGSRFYITAEYPDRFFEFHRVDVREKDAQRLFSFEDKDYNKIYFLVPAEGDRYILVMPPYDVCLAPSWQGSCTLTKYYKGRATLLGRDYRPIKSIDIPKTAHTYYLKGGFLYCLFKNRECTFVDSRLRETPLGIYGFGDTFRGYEFLPLFGEDSSFVVFGDKSYRAFRRCTIGAHARAAFCENRDGSFTLIDIESGKLLGKSIKRLYPEYVYRSMAFGRSGNKLVVLDSEDGKVLDIRRLDCSGELSLEFSRDRAYALCSDAERKSLEVILFGD